MAATSKILAVGIMVFSFIIGLITFYMMSDLSKKEKKEQVEEIISQLINFVIFIWIGKIILNISIFIEDPLAILAYPSDSRAFYFSVLLSGFVLFYKYKKKQMDIVTFIHSFIHVFLVASFLYEFIQFVWNDNAFSFGNMVVIVILMVIFLFMQGYVSNYMAFFTILVLWSIGMFLLSLIQPYITVFGYMIDVWFVGVFLLINVIIIYLNNRKRDV
ncbi:hypothetical protein D8M06_15410 [Oceanobacillus halophilus]|uniref:Uncharacterized protein n=2 Tax=Oceanobacillus halophilus TaxID=930130 RepID=A0A494ZWS4_9BACI|nr:hypothetical protein D8M06_15410 [Oceanobacillus halophilus]